MMTHALETEADYPYSEGSLNYGITGTCTANLTLGVVKTQSPTDYVRVGKTNEDIISAINIKPVSVAIDASQPIF